MIKLINGICPDELLSIDDNSVDAVVTDPPYGLSFMGKKWDYDVPDVEIWKECLRVLKPGGYLLSFAGTRTQHRMAVRIEDAGFEIRDMIAWVYGSGFPKSLNVGKAVDKLLGNEREIVGEKERGDVQKAKENGSGYLADPANRNNVKQFGYGTEIITKGTSEWEGWGTALKPALEPITVARKPLSEKTVAENVLKWGVGAINIDDCRIGYTGDTDPRTFNGSWKTNKAAKNVYEGGYAGTNQTVSQQGRFPANFIHDGSQLVLDLFPETKSGAMKKHYKYTNNGNSLGKPTGHTKQIHDSSSGSAARFFYCAKASKSERNRGCEELEEKLYAPSNQAKAELARGNIEFNDWRGKEQHERNNNNHVGSNKNNHPTVKPVALMEYLVRLVSKENAIILDPFMGSGSTGIACRNLNRNFIGIEMDENYFEIAQNRIYTISKNS